MKKIIFIAKLIKENKIKIVQPSEEICYSYLDKSNNSLKASKLLFEQKLFEESTSMSYYSMFHIVQALYFKIGIKCENHNALIILLKDIFNIDNSKISYAKEERIDKQYYFDFTITKEDTQNLINITQEFNDIIFTKIDTISKDEINDYLKEFEKNYYEEFFID